MGPGLSPNMEFFFGSSLSVTSPTSEAIRRRCFLYYWWASCLKPRRTSPNGLSRWLRVGARGNKALNVDDRKSCGVAAALEIHRLLLGTIDLDNLAWPYNNPNAFC